ncbi:MAG: hypothetical protein ACI9DF_005188, partial [Verrucomicrobiales bacterium]
RFGKRRCFWKCQQVEAPWETAKQTLAKVQV